MRAAPLGIVFLLMFAARSLAADDPIQNAIDKGVKYLKGIHQPVQNYRGGSHGMGSATLAGLALLEAGVPPNDPSLQMISTFVHDNALSQTRTYETSLTIMFLDRLGLPDDRPIIQLLGLRLLGGQGKNGGWSYDCGYELGADEARLKNLFVKDNRLVLKQPPKKEPPKVETRPDIPVEPKSDPVKKDPALVVKSEDKPALHPEVAKWAKLNNIQDGIARKNEDGDNSNTQFATLGLWIARKHGVSCDKAVALLDKRYRTSQDADGGWGYQYQYGGGGSTPSMTCAGMVALAVAHGSKQNVLRNKADNPAPKQGENAAGEDEALKKALKCLGNYITQAKGMPPEGIINPAKKGKRFKPDDLNSNLYFLWSLERVGVTFGLETIGNHDWYTWGSDGLIQTQQANGSWSHGNYHGANEEINTSFALLFLSRANVVRDLSTALKGKVRDPGVSVLRGGSDISSILPNRPDPKVETRPDNVQTPASIDDFEKQAARLANSLLQASANERATVLGEMRDAKGSVYTEALARASAKSTGAAQQETREALARRLTRMTAATLREMLKEQDREVRHSAALACGYKNDKQLASDLFDLLADKEEIVSQAARTSLKTLTGKDFGPDSPTDAAAKNRAVQAWKDWWEGQTK